MRALVLSMLIVAAAALAYADTSVAPSPRASNADEPPFLLVAGNAEGVHVVQPTSWTLIRGDERPHALRADRRAWPRGLVLEEVLSIVLDRGLFAVARARSGSHRKNVVLVADPDGVRVVYEGARGADIALVLSGGSIFIFVREQERERRLVFDRRTQRFTEAKEEERTFFVVPELKGARAIAYRGGIPRTVIPTISRLLDGTRRVEAGDHTIETRVRDGMFEAREAGREWVAIQRVRPGEELFAFPEASSFTAVSADLTHAVHFAPIPRAVTRTMGF